MITNYVCVYDLETNALPPESCQPIQIAAVMYDIRRMEIKDSFESMIRTVPDDECEKYGLHKTTDGALNVNKKTREEIEAAPSAKIVFDNFAQWCKSFKTENSDYGMPIRCGFNNFGYDDIIMRRIYGGQFGGSIQYQEKLISPTKAKSMELKDVVKHLKENKSYKEPYKFGHYDDKMGRFKFWHPRIAFDVQMMTHLFCESLDEPQSKSMDTLRQEWGFKTDNAHDALQDCYDTVKLLELYLKMSRENVNDFIYPKCVEKELKND